MMGIGIPGLIIILVIGIYLINSIKILREYERGVIFRLGRVLPSPKGPGVILVFPAVRPDGACFPASGSTRGAPAGHHYPR